MKNIYFLSVRLFLCHSFFLDVKWKYFYNFHFKRAISTFVWKANYFHGKRPVKICAIYTFKVENRFLIVISTHGFFEDVHNNSNWWRAKGAVTSPPPLVIFFFLSHQYHYQKNTKMRLNHTKLITPTPLPRK